MVSLAINAIPSASASVTIMLGVSLSAAMMAGIVLQVMSLVMPWADPVAVVATMPRMAMLPEISACLAQASIALAIQAAFDAVPRAIEHVGEFPVSIRRGEKGQAIEVQINDRPSLIQSPIFPARFADALLMMPAIDMMSGMVPLAEVAAVVVLPAMAMTPICLGAAGEYEPACEYCADRPVDPASRFHCLHFLFLRRLIQSADHMESDETRGSEFLP